MLPSPGGVTATRGHSHSGGTDELTTTKPHRPLGEDKDTAKRWVYIYIYIWYTYSIYCISGEWRPKSSLSPICPLLRPLLCQSSSQSITYSPHPHTIPHSTYSLTYHWYYIAQSPLHTPTPSPFPYMVESLDGWWDWLCAWDKPSALSHVQV